jgi:hypothetical protein
VRGRSCFVRVFLLHPPRCQSSDTPLDTLDAWPSVNCTESFSIQCNTRPVQWFDTREWQVYGISCW